MAPLQLKDLRDLSVVVVHPQDADGMLVLEQLGRIGCRSEAVWPPPKTFSSPVDVVITGIFRDHQRAIKALLQKADPPLPGVIALIDYENPASLQLMLEINVVAVISKPVRPFGILTNLVVARNAVLTQIELADRIAKLEARLSGLRKIAKAKSILMEAQAISEQDAYKTIRARAMSKRIPIDEMADAIINAHELLSARIPGA